MPQTLSSALTSAAIFLVVTVDGGGERTVRDLLPDLGSPERSVGSAPTRTVC
ncbi:hypothetical protein [Streptomyces sp. NPDC097610]|uniref:hypothetical protein n=1 Tax=Streptomyces sp. NPDC097610 TaxID=3157227 RepID=UPI0033175E1E